MAVALNGNLQDFGIAEVFQLIGQQRKTGMLKIAHAGREVCLAFDSGAVVWGAPAARNEDEILGQRLIRCGYVTSETLTRLYAEAKSSGRSLRALMVAEGVISEADLDALDSLVTQDTIFDVLRWSEGSFNFSSQAITHDRPQEKLLGAEQILMDGLRMVDEWQTFRGSVPALDTIVERSNQVLEHRQQTRREGEAHTEQLEKLIQLVDGRLTLQRIIDLSRLGLFDATRIIAELMEAGLIVPLEKKRARSVRRHHEGERSLGQRVLTVVAACVPVAILCGMLHWIDQAGPSGPERIEAFPITRRVIDDARVLFEKRRIRHALEAYRYRTGEWPEALEELAGAGWLDAEAMAAGAPAAYYYRRGEHNVVLLAPER